MSKAFGRLFQRHPLAANSGAMAVLFGAGDMLAQVGTQDTPAAWDPHQTGRQALYGAAFAPINRQWVQFLSTVKPLPLRVAIDQLLFAPAGVALYFSAMAFLEGDAVAAVRSRLAHAWWPTVKANWAVWPAVQTVNLGYVPLAYQVAVGGCVGVLWNGYLAYCNWEARRQQQQAEAETRAETQAQATGNAGNAAAVARRTPRA